LPAAPPGAAALLRTHVMTGLIWCRIDGWFILRALAAQIRFSPRTCMD
jgi:hypothetical protein